MKTFPLSIRFANRPVHQPAAWFIPGDCAEVWLAEVGAWNVSLGSLTFYPVPRSIGDNRPRGVLVIIKGVGWAVPTTPGDVPVGAAHPTQNRMPRVSPRAIPYGRFAERLYLPVDAVISPPVSEEELKSLFAPDQEAYVWHPTGGLSGFKAGEGRAIGQLLSFPPPVDSDWNAARPGTAVNTRLWSVEPEEIPGIEEILETSRGDIGSLASDLSELPTAPDEPSGGGLQQFGDKVLEGLARAGLWLASLVPHTGTSETWVNRLESRLQSLIQKAAQAANLRSAQARELQRLLHLLKSDPDQGLKYALPFGGASNRGLAPPSGKLMPREVNFNLSSPGGGGPADFWNVPYEMQQRLFEEYRRLANRELNLGRHRRAAYIFAELLNDLPTAAAALVAGNHFREAAVLYVRRLKQPLEAAKCLENGKLWSEALELYEELGEFEKAGDLARRLEQTDDATLFYRQAERVARDRGDVLTAARILEDKQSLPDEALGCLIAGWTSTFQARKCLGESFRLLARLGRHDDARGYLTKFAEERALSLTDGDFAAEVADVAKSYPDEPVRAVAADTVRIVAASGLSQATPHERRALLDAVQALAPEDRLLERDCRRYFDTHSRAILRIADTVRNRVPEVVFVREYRLPDHVHWVAASSTDMWYYAAGFRDRELVVVQGTWMEPSMQYVVTWPVEPAHTNLPVLLVPDHQNITVPAPVFVHSPGGPPYPARISVPRDPLTNWRFGSPAWTSPTTIAFARGTAGVSRALNWSNGELSLSVFNARQTPVETRTLSIPESLRPVVFHALQTQAAVPMEVGDSTTYIGLGPCLVIVRPQGSTEFVEMPHPIRGLTCSMPYTRHRVAVTFETGGQIFWDEPGHRIHQWFATTLAAPAAVFTHRGWLVAASSDECEVYSTNDRRVRLAATCRWTDRTLLAVLKTGAADEFAVCCADGRILSYKVPANA